MLHHLKQSYEYSLEYRHNAKSGHKYDQLNDIIANASTVSFKDSEFVNDSFPPYNHINNKEDIA